MHYIDDPTSCAWFNLAMKAKKGKHTEIFFLGFKYAAIIVLIVLFIYFTRDVWNKYQDRMTRYITDNLIQGCGPIVPIFGLN